MGEKGFFFHSNTGACGYRENLSRLLKLGVGHSGSGRNRFRRFATGLSCAVPLSFSDLAGHGQGVD